MPLNILLTLYVLRIRNKDICFVSDPAYFHKGPFLAVCSCRKIVGHWKLSYCSQFLPSCPLTVTSFIHGTPIAGNVIATLCQSAVAVELLTILDVIMAGPVRSPGGGGMAIGVAHTHRSIDVIFNIDTFIFKTKHNNAAQLNF